MRAVNGRAGLPENSDVTSNLAPSLTARMGGGVASSASQSERVAAASEGLGWDGFSATGCLKHNYFTDGKQRS